jgi:hypothetical protein
MPLTLLHFNGRSDIIRTIICKQCNKPFQTESKRKDKRLCQECLKENQVKSVMRSRKKRIPTTEIGVGSGKSSKNLNRPLGIQTYRRAKDDKCIKCGSTKNLLVHHKDENRYNNSIDNLETLCKRCHQKLHTKRDLKTGRYMAK